MHESCDFVTQSIKFHSWESVTKSGWQANIFFLLWQGQSAGWAVAAVGSAIKGAFTFNLIKNLNIQITKRKSFQNYAYTDAWSRQTDRPTLPVRQPWLRWLPAPVHCVGCHQPMSGWQSPQTWGTTMTCQCAQVNLSINYNDISVCTGKSQCKLSN